MTYPDRQRGAVDAIQAYHNRTKHHPEHYARGPGGMDWANQPNPFRRFAGAVRVALPLAGDGEGAGSGVLFEPSRLPPQALTLRGLGKFFELSLGLSARKTIAGSSWYLRMNPSSGNLHPTEGYALLPPIDGLAECAGVYHYAPWEHALEQRAVWPRDMPWAGSGFWVAFSSITWREAWKYGERAFRYCQHDLGHALAAVRYAAATLGWRVRMAPGWTDDQLAHWLGLDREDDYADAEREIPELLVRVEVGGDGAKAELPREVQPVRWTGRANRLSPLQHPWSAIDAAILATKRIEPPTMPDPGSDENPGSVLSCLAGRTPAELLIRRRRSAVSFDGATGLSRETFLAILETTVPQPAVPPFDAWPWPARLHLVLFVHRVESLPSGLYAWLRDPGVKPALQAACKKEFEWAPVTDSTELQPLYRLVAGDMRDFACAVSCGQDIAADGAFSLGMLACFEAVLREHGAAAYRELFWEAGMIGQALYLAAEAAEVRGTGIGCYFDDVMHHALGLTGHEWQSLYHFTVGGPVEDPRLQTVSPYEHLEDPATRGSTPRDPPG